MYANSMNSANQRTVGQNMTEKILTGRKFGIHPLEAIGGNSSPSATIPMQNPFGGTQQVQQQDPTETRTKKLIMEQLENEAKDRKYKYSLLVPVSLKGEPNKKYWGLNSHYFGYTFVASSIQAAANGQEAWAKLLETLSDDEKKEIDRVVRDKKLQAPEWIMNKRGIK